MWGSQTVWVWPECQVARQAALPRLPPGWRVLDEVRLTGKEGGRDACTRHIHSSSACQPPGRVEAKAAQPLRTNTRNIPLAPRELPGSE